jgi:NADPH:quinone reductase-like Zn-dependent oxidoreductase
MRAITYAEYGPPDVIRLAEIDKPIPGDGHVLVRVRAASVNPYDWHELRGKPYFVRAQSGLRRPKNPRLGVDVAGSVEAVGEKVTEFEPGDEVFGGAAGAFAEYVCGSPTSLVAKPADVSFEEAATLNIAGITALQGLRDRGGLRPGRRVLVNGASGGVGTFAVQIAKAMGAHVTGVCGTGNVELVRSIGADEVVDYTREDFAAGGEHYDVILDNVATRRPGVMRGILTADGRYVAVGSLSMGDWIGPITFLAGVSLAGLLRSQTMSVMLAQTRADDLAELGRLVASGAVKPVIDRTYPLEQTAMAIAYVEAGHVPGKVVITV